MPSIYVLIITIAGGNDVTAHHTAEGALAFLAAYCRERWPTISEEDPAQYAPPLDDGECIDSYFTQSMDESYEIHLAAVMGGPA